MGLVIMIVSWAVFFVLLWDVRRKSRSGVKEEGSLVAEMEVADGE